MNKITFILITSLLVIALSVPVIAATKSWVPTAGGIWTTAGNWSPSGAPATGDDVTIPADQSANITAMPTIALNSLTIIWHLFIGSEMYRQYTYNYN